LDDTISYNVKKIIDMKTRHIRPDRSGSINKTRNMQRMNPPKNDPSVFKVPNKRPKNATPKNKTDDRFHFDHSLECDHSMDKEQFLRQIIEIAPININLFNLSFQENAPSNTIREQSIPINQSIF